MQRKTSRRDQIEAHISSILNDLIPPNSPLLQATAEGDPEAIKQLSIIENNIRRALLSAARKPFETQPIDELGIKLGELVPEGGFTRQAFAKTAGKIWDLWLEFNVPHSFRSSLLDGSRVSFNVETSHGDITGHYDPSPGILSAMKSAWQHFRKVLPEDKRLAKELTIYWGWNAAQNLMSDWREDLHDFLYLRWKIAEFETKRESETFAATMELAEGQNVGNRFRVKQQLTKRERSRRLGKLYQTLRRRKNDRLDAKVSNFDYACLGLYEQVHRSCKQIYKHYRVERKKFFGGKRETEKRKKEWQREWERIFETLNYDKVPGIILRSYDFFKKKPEEIAFGKVESLTGLSPTTLRTKLLPLIRQRRKGASLDIND